MTLEPQDGTTMNCVMPASNPVALKYGQAALEPLTVIAKVPHSARNGFHPSGGVGIAYPCPQSIHPMLYIIRYRTGSPAPETYRKLSWRRAASVEPPFLAGVVKIIVRCLENGALRHLLRR